MLKRLMDALKDNEEGLNGDEVTVNDDRDVLRGDWEASVGMGGAKERWGGVKG